MDKVFILFSLMLVSVCTSHSVFASLEFAHFEKWLAEHEIELQEPDKAWPVWKENVEFVYRQNSLGLSYRVDLNDFAHLVRIA